MDLLDDDMIGEESLLDWQKLEWIFNY
jgi:hypothetical protein